MLSIITAIDNSTLILLVLVAGVAGLARGFSGFGRPDLHARCQRPGDTSDCSSSLADH